MTCSFEAVAVMTVFLLFILSISNAFVSILNSNETCIGEYQLCNTTFNICALTNTDCKNNNCKRPGQYVCYLYTELFILSIILMHQTIKQIERFVQSLNNV